jgi:integrase/recombinase XerD
MATVEKVTYTRPIPPGAKIITRRGGRLARFKCGGRIVEAPLSPDGRKCRVESGEWYVRYKDTQGRWRRTKGYTDRQATEALAVDIQKRINREEAGLTDPFEEHHRRPLADHLADFDAVLGAKWCAKHVQGVVGRARRVIDGCGFQRIGDIQASRVEMFLGEMTEQGYSVQTCNHHLRAIKQFCRWLVKDRRTGDNRIAHLDCRNADVDRRRVRRALSAGEVEALLLAALRSPSTLKGLTGEDRFVLYSTALGSGLRASEVASLTPESFHLEADPPVVIVEAGRSKRRRRDEQPLQPDVANILRDYLATKPAGRRIWPGHWHKRAAEMLRVDLEAAGIAYVNDAGEVVDFHGARHTYITVAAKHVPPKMAQALARHSTPILTEKYTHLELHDTGAAAAQLPPLLPAVGTEVKALRATGTDSPGVGSLRPACKILGTLGHLEARAGTKAPREAGAGESPEAVNPQRLGTAGHAESQVGMGGRVVYGGSLENC